MIVAVVGGVFRDPVFVKLNNHLLCYSLRSSLGSLWTNNGVTGVDWRTQGTDKQTAACFVEVQGRAIRGSR